MKKAIRSQLVKLKAIPFSHNHAHNKGLFTPSLTKKDLPQSRNHFVSTQSRNKKWPLTQSRIPVRGLKHLKNFQFFFNHGEGKKTKWVILRAILQHFQKRIQERCGKWLGNYMNEISQMKAFLVHLHRWILKIFFTHDEGNHEKICQYERHSRVSSKIDFANFLQPWGR